MTLRWHIDLLSRRQVVGWAQDATVPDTPVSLVVSVDGRPVGRCHADRPRDDLVREGYSHGSHGFDFTLPDGARSSECRRSSGCITGGTARTGFR